ncbi:MAG: HEPN domain-containing protein [Crenarchaeota archaeon]|nr:HEPN domain-containing protein [Thermoproteota archaeon]
MTNNLELATAYIEEARKRLRTARQALEEKAYAYCIRQCQEAVELSLKAALRLIGIEPPKVHDVGPILVRYGDRFPEFFKEEIPELAAISRWPRREKRKEPSMYGDEELGIPPTQLYTEPYARKAYESAISVLEEVEKLLKHMISS